jgi:hypothetical protein
MIKKKLKKKEKRERKRKKEKKEKRTNRHEKYLRSTNIETLLKFETKFTKQISTIHN